MKNPFAHFARARDKPQDAVSAAPAFYFGTSTSGKAVNPSSAIQVSAVYACVRVIAETIASLPFHVYENTESGSRKATEHPLYRIIHDEPVQRVLRRLASSVLCRFKHMKRQAGNGFSNYPNTGIYSGNLYCGGRIDRLAGCAGTEVEGRRGGNRVRRLVPRTKHTGKWILHISLQMDIKIAPHF